MRKTVHPLEVGDTFDEVREGPFGQARRLRWRIQRLYTGADGGVYVQLRRDEDGTLKTLSQNALLDRTFFRRVN